MTLSDLQTSTGMFTIAAFDHRSSLSGKLGMDLDTEDGTGQFMQLKRLFMETFSPICSAVLTDPIYGKESVQYKDEQAGLLMSVEKSGYSSDKGTVPKLVENWGAQGVKQYGGAVKMLLYIHPYEPNAGEKVQLVQDIYRQCQEAEVPFLFEPVLYPIEDESEFYQKWAEFQQQVVTAFTNWCDVLKIEYPGLHAKSVPDQVAACEAISERATVPWILLSRGMEFEPYKKALTISLQHGAKGFAVGRGVWQEIEQYSLEKTQDWSTTFAQIREFLRTTGVGRMKELISLVDGE